MDRRYKTSREPREFEKVNGGYMDELGFYNLPDGGKSLSLSLLFSF